jgi:hypothetical protein
MTIGWSDYVLPIDMNWIKLYKIMKPARRI